MEKPKEEIQKIELEEAILLVGYKGYLTHHRAEIFEGKQGDRIFLPFTPKEVEGLIEGTEKTILGEHDDMADLEKEMTLLKNLNYVFRQWRNAREESDVKWGEWVRAEAQKNRGK